MGMEKRLGKWTHERSFQLGCIRRLKLDTRISTNTSKQFYKMPSYPFRMHSSMVHAAINHARTMRQTDRLYDASLTINCRSERCLSSAAGLYAEFSYMERCMEGHISPTARQIRGYPNTMWKYGRPQNRSWRRGRARTFESPLFWSPFAGYVPSP